MSSGLRADPSWSTSSLDFFNFSRRALSSQSSTQESHRGKWSNLPDHFLPFSALSPHKISLSSTATAGVRRRPRFPPSSASRASKKGLWLTRRAAWWCKTPCHHWGQGRARARWGNEAGGVGGIIDTRATRSTRQHSYFLTNTALFLTHTEHLVRLKGSNGRRGG